MMNIATKTYESLLPFLVVEAISAQGASFNTMSVGMIDEGWSWLVSGRKLLVWKFKENNKESNLIKARRMLSPCFELQLPQTDLNHKADLINCFFMPQNLNTSMRAATIPAIVAISPEGIVRFWSNVANERFTEACVADVQGQEFCSLITISPFEYVLGTTTGSVYILNIDIMAHDHKNIIACSPLATPSGILSGIGRRVTNLFFGPMATEVGAETRRPLIAIPKYSQSTIQKTGSTDRPFFVMNSTFKLRQWSRTNEGANSVNQLVREWDLQRNVYNNLISELGLSQSDHLNFWPIDMIPTKSKELLILIVTLDAARENTVNYATCVFNPYQAGDSISHLNVLKSHTWQYTNESEDQLLSLRFLERRANNVVCFIYDRKFLFLVNLEQDILDALDYANQDDSILGAGIVDNHPILFTQRDGLTYIASVISNKSRLDETSIQLEPPPPAIPSAQTAGAVAEAIAPENASRVINQSITNQSILRNDASIRQQHSTSTRTESASLRNDPMLVDIDMEDESISANNFASQRSKNSNQVYRNRIDRDQSMINKANLDQSATNNKSMSAADQSTIASKRKGDSISEILKENKEFEWIQCIDNKEYGLASEMLAKLAEGGETLVDRKETLIALSKLTKMAE